MSRRANGTGRHYSHPNTVTHVRLVDHDHGRNRRSERPISHARRGMPRGSTIAEEKQGRSRRKLVLIGLLILLLIVGVAISIGVFTYFKTTNSNLDLGSDISKSLSNADKDEPFFVLCMADLDNKTTLNVEEESKGFMLVRVDEQGRKLSFVSVPQSLQVRMSDGQSQPLYMAHSIGGDAEIIESLSDLLDIDIAHYIFTNADHMKNMVDHLDGVDLDVVEEVDDPNAGIEVIRAGDQRLNGKQALTYLRSTNYTGGFERVATNRVSFTLRLLEEALNNEGIGFASAVSDVSAYIGTDLNASDILSMGDGLRPMSTLEIYSTVLPTYESYDNQNEEIRCNLYKSQWAKMLDLLKNGDDPGNVDSSSQGVIASDISVEVRNGTQMAGAAAKLGGTLSGYGYQVIGVGNTDDGTIYPETLIVYTDSAYEGAAKAIASQISSGRAINGGDYYSSEAGVIVIIGADFVPVS